MSGEADLQELQLVCGERMVTANDGSQVPVPVGEIAGVTDAYGRPAYIPEDAPVQASQIGDGYYIVVNCAPAENDEAAELWDKLKDEAFDELLEQVFLKGAPRLFKAGLSVAGLLADVLTTSKLTREVMIKGDYNGVPLKICILM